MRTKREIVSYKMSRVRASNTGIEERMASALRKEGLRGYRRNVRGVLGTPDFCWKGKKIAVFCDSSFWHGYDWMKAKLQIKVRKKFWLKKIEDNIKRDRSVTTKLKNDGWHVLRFWDFEIKNDIQICVKKILLVFRNDGKIGSF